MEQIQTYKFPKKLAICALLVGSLSFIMVPALARHHGFTGGAVKDPWLIAEEVVLQSEKMQEKKMLMDKYILLVQKFCALTGLKVPGVISTLDKYSNSIEQLKGKSVSSLNQLPATDQEILEDMGKYDLRSYSGLRAYEKHLKEKYKLNDIEALTLMQQYARNQNVKDYYLQEIIAKPIAKKIDGVKSTDTASTDGASSDGESGSAEVGSRVAAVQQSNMVNHMQGRAEIDNAQSELVQKSNKLEREQLEYQMDRATAVTGNIHPRSAIDPYHMTDHEREIWEKQNTPDIVDFTFDGKKHEVSDNERRSILQHD